MTDAEKLYPKDQCPHFHLVNDWINNEVKEHGLVDIKFFRTETEVEGNSMMEKVENVSKELWGLLNAPTIEDAELF